MLPTRGSAARIGQGTVDGGEREGKEKDTLEEISKGQLTSTDFSI